MKGGWAVASVTVIGEELHVALTAREKVAGLHGDLRVPIRAVRDVHVEDDALEAVRGVRAPGLAIPGRTKIGTWRRRGWRTFAVARRGVPAVRLALSGARHDELIASTHDARGVAAAVRARVGGDPDDVGGGREARG